jgi:15-cis-phytoene synthase
MAAKRYIGSHIITLVRSASVEPQVPLAESEQQSQLEKKAVTDLLRRRDRERYWTALFAPAAKRPALLALYAFDTELTHIAAAVTEPMVGQIRLQWWRDAIDLAAPGTKTGNPIADALTSAILEYRLSKERLIAMADARIPEIFGDPPASIQALRATLQETQGTIFEFAAAILGSESEVTKKAAEQAGLAYGLMQTLRTLPLQAARKKLLLPPSYFESRGVTPATIFRGKTNASLGAALSDLRGACYKALHQFRTLAPQLDPAVWPAFLPLALVKPYLKAMAAHRFDPLHTVPSVNPVRQFWRVWRAVRRHRL